MSTQIQTEDTIILPDAPQSPACASGATGAKLTYPVWSK